jgi:mono/diheme cytochrome c family protein
MLVACTQSEAPATPTPTLAPQLAQGKQLFSLHCASCHAVESNTVIVGPSLSGVADRADEREPQMTAHEYVERSILQPGAFVVPGFDNLMPENLGKRLDGEELDAIVAYVMSLQ